MWAWQLSHPAFAPTESASSMATQSTATGMATAPLELPKRERKLSLLLLDENADKYFGHATEGAMRMQVLIQDLLTYSRLDQNGVARKQVDCNKVVEEVLRDLSLAIRESGAIIHCGPLPTLWANHSHLIQ